MLHPFCGHCALRCWLLLYGRTALSADSSRNLTDRLAYCRALNGSGSAQCGFIRDADLQALCRAETGGGSAQCGFINDRDMQAACPARARN